MHVCHTIADVVDRAKAERSENTLRKDFTPSELLAAGRRIAELEPAEESALSGRSAVAAEHVRHQLHRRPDPVG
ncbi:hypothetical protein W054_04081, partial [Mycobacterium tuberculosis TB_RSA144]